MRTWLLLGAALAPLALFAAAPAFADVKAGVDAWARGDFRKAVEEWRGLAIAGDADAQFNLGQAYKLGRGVPVDPALAESWFRKAALQGHEQAQDNYALALFQSGRRQEAVPWLEKSVARGEPRTQLVLGTMLFNGDGAPRDYPRAYALMTRAAAAGLPSASQTLAQMDQYITPPDRERGTALAQQYAAQAAARPSSGGRGVTELPPSRPPEPAATPTPVAGKPTAKPTPKPVPTAVAAKPRPTRTPVPTPTATPAAAAARPKAMPSTVAAKPAVPTTGGSWKVQLGAFRDRGNAEALWAKLRGKLGGATPIYTTAGPLTRLQATGFAGKAAAQRACAAAGGGCVVIAP